MFIIYCSLLIGTVGFQNPRRQVHHQKPRKLNSKDLVSANTIVNITADVIQDSNQRIATLYDVRVDNVQSAPYEVGYLVHTIQEKYRKMVDKYNTSHFMNTSLYIIEHVMYLEEIEHHYWEIEHLANMAHEIERKYKIFGGIHSDFREHERNASIKIITSPPTPVDPYLTTRKKNKRPKGLWNPGNAPQTTSRRPRGPFPLIYGWSFEGVSSTSLDLKNLLDELSWTLRLKVLNHMDKPFSNSNLMEQPTNIQPPSADIKERGLDTVSKYTANRRVGVEAQIAQEKQPTETQANITADENNMRLKLFRLMYETVRDSDVKVKRAELIEEHYNNNTSFQIGYLMGDVTDKYNVITDISTTLERFYKEWKPIEHINAYEQIANQAIEINHLIDLMKTVNRGDPEL